VLIPLIAALCACAGGDGRYPSLAMRPFETAPPPVAAPPVAEPFRPLADSAAIDALVARAVEADGAFARQRPAAERLAQSAAGQPVESNVRAAALVAMADLAAKRGAASAVLADLDQLAAQSAIAFAPEHEIELARDKVATLVAGQDAVIARLWKEMGQ
jgi:hypothetical protein